jgi:hypothetical protein
MTKKKQFCPKGHDAFKGGRDRSGRCLICREEAAAARAALEERAIAERQAAFERQWAEIDRRREQEYQRAIAAGGRAAAEARWNRAYDEESTFGLCQWEDEVEGEYTHVCFNRTRDVYCAKHNRQLERETERRRNAEAKMILPSGLEP